MVTRVGRRLSGVNTTYKSRATERSNKEKTWREVQAGQARRAAAMRRGPASQYSKEEVRFYRKVFEMLDIDGGGSIDEEEFVQGLCKELAAADESESFSQHGPPPPGYSAGAGASSKSDRMRFIEALHKGLQIGYSSEGNAGKDDGSPGSIRARARAIFHHIDVDGGGSIEFGEMLAALYPLATESELAKMESWAPATKREEVEVGSSVARLAKAWGDLDLNDDTGARKRAIQQRDDEKAMRRLFKGYDKDGDGELTLNEMAEAFKSTGLDKDEIREIFREADIDSNGSIDFSEFRLLMAKVMDEQSAGTTRTTVTTFSVEQD